MSYIRLLKDCIHANGMNHPFRKLMKETAVLFSELIFFANFHWLSIRRVLQKCLKHKKCLTNMQYSKVKKHGDVNYVLSLLPHCM